MDENNLIMSDNLIDEKLHDYTDINIGDVAECDVEQFLPEDLDTLITENFDAEWLQKFFNDEAMQDKLTHDYQDDTDQNISHQFLTSSQKVNSDESKGLQAHITQTDCNHDRNLTLQTRIKKTEYDYSKSINGNGFSADEADYDSEESGPYDMDFLGNVVEVVSSPDRQSETDSVWTNQPAADCKRETDQDGDFDDDDDEPVHKEDYTNGFNKPDQSSCIEAHHNYCFTSKPTPPSSPSSNGSLSPNTRIKKSKSSSRGVRTNKTSDATLTDEEIRLLYKEGYTDFPINSSMLTKQEERILRKIRRKIRNKRSAQCSRQRKKEYLDDLERRFQKCADDNSSLREENKRLKKVNETLLIKLKHFLFTSSVSGNNQTSFKTSLFVLVLSFLLLLVPSLRPDNLDFGYLSSSNDGVSLEESFSRTGRQLLEVLPPKDNFYDVHTEVNKSDVSRFNFDSLPSSIILDEMTEPLEVSTIMQKVTN